MSDRATTIISFGGCALILLFGIVFLVLFVGALFFDWMPFADPLMGFWRAFFGDPLLRLTSDMVEYSNGQAAYAIAALALITWLMYVAVRFPGSLMQKLAVDMTRRPLRTVQHALKDMFDNEPDTLAIVRIDSADDPAFDSQKSGGGIWIKVAVGIVVSFFLGIVAFLVAMGVFSALLEVFVSEGGAQQLSSERSASASIPPVDLLFGSPVEARSLMLSLALLVVLFVRSMVESVAVSGWTFSRALMLFPLAFVIPFAVLAFIFLNAVLLLFAVCFQTFELLGVAFWKFIGHRIVLRLASAPSDS